MYLNFYLFIYYKICAIITQNLCNFRNFDFHRISYYGIKFAIFLFLLKISASFAFTFFFKLRRFNICLSLLNLNPTIKVTTYNKKKNKT